MAAAETVLALRMVGVQRTLAFVEQALLTLLGTAKPANLRILEVGCGYGTFAKLLAAKFPDATVTAIDAFHETIERAKTEAPPVPANLTLQTSDFMEMEAADGSYDLIVFTRSLHHIYGMPQAVQKAHRLLRTGGVIALQEFARERMDVSTAKWLYDRLELLEAAGVWTNARKRAGHFSLPVPSGAEPPKDAHGHGHAHGEEKAHAHAHGEAKEHGHGEAKEHAHSHEAGKEKHSHAHAHEHGHGHGHAHGAKEEKKPSAHGHGHAHGHNHEGAPDLSDWRTRAKKDPMQLWADFHWHAVPLSLGSEMVAAVAAAFGAVHYQEPRTPYLYAYAEHGLKANVDAGAPIVPGRHLEVLNAFLEQELVRMGEHPEGSVGLNIAAQKK